MNELSSKMVEGVELMANAALANSGLPKTIDCEIIELKDAATGLYTVRYMENEIEVYASSPTLQYNTGEKVSVLVPSGDMAKTKYIIGAAVPAGYMYSSLSSISDDTSDGRIVEDGDIFSFNDIELCSFTPTNNTIDITDSYSIELLRKNIEDGHRDFTFTFEIKTNLPQEQKRNGNYGLIFKIPVLVPSEIAGSEFIESWVVASLTAVDAQRNLQGRVYDFTEFTLQSKDFEVPANAIYDGTRNPQLIELVEDFIEKEDKPNDIFFKNIAIKGLIYLPLTENDGNYLAIVATEGSYFSNNPGVSPIKTLSPVLKLHGKNKAVDGYDCYWYVEDSRIKKIDDNGYETHGGFGWHCLNSKKILQTQEDGTEEFQWVTNVYTLDVNREDVYTSLNYKCVLVQADFSISGEIALKNLQPLYETILTTVEGPVIFSPNHGKINMAARIKRTDDVYSDNIILSVEWQRFDKNGNLIEELPGDPEIGDINEKETHIEEGSEVIDWLRSTVAYRCATVKDTNLIRCTFIEKKVDSITGAITTKVVSSNQLAVYTTEGAFDYKINIINNRYSYNYDSDGDSPMVADYDGPASSVVKEIKPISFSIFNKDGIELTDDDYAFCNITWGIPKNSMILKVGNETRSDNNYYYFDYAGRLGSDLYYTIAPNFDTKKAYNSSITLEIKYKEYELKETIPLIFTKDGKSGTNGTKFSAVITYNGYAYEEISRDNIGRTIKNKFLPTCIMSLGYMGDVNTTWGVYYPIVDDNERIYNRIKEWSYADRTLELKLYKDGKLIENPEGVYSVEWSILDPATTNSFFTIDQNGQINKESWAPSMVDSTTITGRKYPVIVPQDPCHIVKAEVTIFSDAVNSTYQQKLYAFYPIDMFVIQANENISWSFDNTEFNLLDVVGGYNNVMYASDGTNPQYDNTADFGWGNTFSRTDNDLSKYVAASSQYSTWCAYDSENFIEGTVRQSDKSSFHVRPVQKYANGKTKGLIGGCALVNHNHYEEYSYWDEDAQDTIYVVDEVQDGIETDITNLEQEIYDLQQEYNEDYTFKSNLEVFQRELDNNEIFSYNNYIEELNDTKDLLTSRSYLLSYLRGLLEKLTELSEYTDGKTVTFVPTLSNSITFLETMRSNLLHFGDPDSSTRKTTSDIYPYLVSSNVTSISFNEALTQSLYGLSVRLKIKSYVDSINELLVTYFAEVDRIRNLSSDCSLFTQFRIDLNNYLINNAPLSILSSNDNMGEEFRAHKILITSMFDKLSVDCTGYEQILKMLNEFKNEHMKYAQNYYTTKYTNIVNKVLYLKNEKERFLLDLQGIVIYNNIRYYKSVHLYLNYYEMSNLNEWDGTKIYIDEDGQYILSPQLGAGYKDEANKYTGLVMGITNINTQSSTTPGTPRTGLLGLSHGEQSLFINAETGSAVFGKNKGGKIIIDPNQTTAMIYSDNYWRTSNQDGIPTSYSSSNMTYKGMLINLSDSFIHFGENVSESRQTIDSIDKVEGIINSYFEKYNPTIGKIEITDKFEYVFNYADRLEGRAYQGVWIAANPAGYVVLLTIGEYYQPPGDSDHTYMTKTDEGSSTTFRYMGYTPWYSAWTIYRQYVCQYTNGEWVDITYPPNYGYDRDSSNEEKSVTYAFTCDADWLVAEGVPNIAYSVVKYGRLYSGHHTELKSTQPGFYLDGGGLSIGSKFKVKVTENGGTLLLGEGAVAETGKHWTVDSNSTGNSFIAYGTTTFAGTGNDQVYIGTDGIRLGNNFKVDSGGNLTSVTGSIGGWTIGSNYLSANGITLFSTGTITSNNFSASSGWQITAAGLATFQNLVASVGGTIGGWTINGNLLIGGNNVITLDGNSGRIYTGTATTALSGTGFILDSDGLRLLKNGTKKFEYKSNGDLVIRGTIYASAGEFTGKITSSEGEIGLWKINANGFYYTGETIDGRDIQITPTTTVVKYLYCDSIHAYSEITGKKFRIANGVDTNVTIAESGYPGITILNGGLSFGVTGGGINMNGTFLTGAGRISFLGGWGDLVTVVNGVEEGLDAYVQRMIQAALGSDVATQTWVQQQNYATITQLNNGLNGKANSNHSHGSHDHTVTVDGTSYTTSSAWIQ